MPVAHLIVVRADGADGACFPVENEEAISLGRDLSCEIRIRLPAVSRVHAKLVARDSKVNKNF